MIPSSSSDNESDESGYENILPEAAPRQLKSIFLFQSFHFVSSCHMLLCVKLSHLSIGNSDCVTFMTILKVHSQHFYRKKIMWFLSSSLII